MFWHQFKATGQLRTVFWSSYRFLTKDAKFKQIDSCAECFDANFEEKDSWARCFGQVIACYKNTPSSSRTKVVQSVFTPILMNWTVASFIFLTKGAKCKQNDSCAQCFDANLKRQDSWARCFGQVIACYKNTPSSSRTKVVQSVLTPILMNWTVAHGVLKKF